MAVALCMHSLHCVIKVGLASLQPYVMCRRPVTCTCRRHHKHHSSDRHRSSDKHRSDDKHRSSDSKRLDNGSGSRHPDSKSRDSKRHESSSGSKRHRSDREPAAPAGDAKNAAGSRPIADERETATPADLPPPPSDHAGDATSEVDGNTLRPLYCGFACASC